MILPGITFVIKTISIFFSSWILIHLLAVFGFFLALSYPVWWLLFPKQTVCFMCRVKKEGETCPFCRRIIQPVEGSSPKNLLSSVYNGLLVLLFFLISVTVVFAESQLLFKMGFPPTPKTVSFVIPKKGQYRIGEIFKMKIEISGIKVPINAVQADLAFDPEKIEVIDVSTEESFADIFVQKEIDNVAGYLRLTGGLPNPGFFSDHGIFGTVHFKAAHPGIVKVEFLPSSMVLANDGRGTNVLKDLQAVSYLVLPEKITKEEEELQKSITLMPVVLGKSTTNTQMKFYEDNKVLGAQTTKEIQEKKDSGVVKNLVGALEKIDAFTLSLWNRVLNLH
jgi:hypothetical protein